MSDHVDGVFRRFCDCCVKEHMGCSTERIKLDNTALDDSMAEIFSRVGAAAAARSGFNAATALSETAKLCESPIESYMLAALTACAAQMEDNVFLLNPAVGPSSEPRYTHLLDGFGYDSKLERPTQLGAVSISSRIAIVPQFKIGGFRADFMVELWDGCALPTDRAPINVRLLVECDGHAFHDKTKEQAARDKSRDRSITAHGLPVMRFTGSEIHKNAFTCAMEVMDFLFAENSRIERELMPHLYAWIPSVTEGA